MNRRKVGARGEELAAAYLRRKGYSIVERNYRAAGGEVDIIARKGNSLVFVEVKTDRSGEFGPPELWVTPAKRRQIAKVASSYLTRNPVSGLEARFDVIGVNLEGPETAFNHIEDAFWI